MIKEQEFPTPLGVTMSTLFGKPSLMLIVSLVAGIAIDRSLVFVQMPLMTGLAFGCDMSTPQRIFGVQVMVECDRLPIAFRVTSLAFLSVRPSVLVIFLVAGKTI
jgi:hypothetical protein